MSLAPLSVLWLAPSCVPVPSLHGFASDPPNENASKPRLETLAR